MHSLPTSLISSQKNGQTMTIVRYRCIFAATRYVMPINAHCPNSSKTDLNYPGLFPQKLKCMPGTPRADRSPWLLWGSAMSCLAGSVKEVGPAQSWLLAAVLAFAFALACFHSLHDGFQLCAHLLHGGPLLWQRHPASLHQVHHLHTPSALRHEPTLSRHEDHLASCMHPTIAAHAGKSQEFHGELRQCNGHMEGLTRFIVLDIETSPLRKKYSRAFGQGIADLERAGCELS